MPEEKDLYSLPLEELKRLAFEESNNPPVVEAAAAAAPAPAKEEPKPAVEEQPKSPAEYVRDEKGRFTKTEEKPAEVKVEEPEEEEESEPELYVARRVIDLGEGAGEEVFEAEGETETEALEALLDKISDAKKHASKKIRSQEAELREVRSRVPEKPQPKVVDADAEYVYSQELLKSPTKAFRAIFKELTGREIEEFSSIAQREEMFSKATQTNNAISSFIATHPLYEDTSKNSAAMTLALQGKPVTGEELHKAYLHLSKSGLLDLKVDEEAHADTETKPRSTARIEQPKVAEPEKRTKKSSGLSTNPRTSAVPASGDPSEDEMYDLPLEEIKRRANQQLQKPR
jgi:hypothetical protein